MKLTFKKKALGAVAAGLIGVSMAGGAQADVSATSMSLLLMNFSDNATGEILDYNADFSGNLTFTSTADTFVQLSGFGTDSGTATNPPTNPIDLPNICVGSGCDPIAPNNSYPTLSGAVTGSYSAADQNESGAPITGVPDGGGGTFATPAEVNNAAYVGINEPLISTASANANNNLNSSFVFTVSSAIAIDINFDATAYLEAFVSGGETFPGFATASYNVDFTIANLDAAGAIVFQWAPDGAAGCGVGCTENADPYSLNATVSLNAPLPGDIASTGGIHTVGTASTGFFSATTLFLTPGTLYQLSARNVTNADAGRVNEVPEPTILALMGISLLGMGAVRRRRKTA